MLVTFRARNQIFRIRARVLASKLLHFVSLTDCFIMLDEKLLNSILHVNQQKLLNGNFEKRAPGQIRMRQSPSPPPHYTIRNESPFQFTWYQNEISYQNENFIRSQNRNQLNPGKIQWNLLKNNNKKKTRIVRALWLAERCVFAWKSVNMVVTSSCFSIRANHPSTNLKKWVENSTNLLYSPINSRSETLENLVFRLNILSEKNPYFGKHLLL